MVWDNHNGCEHEWETRIRKGQSGGTASEKVQIKGQENFQIVPDSVNAFCHCGAWLGCLGLEPTPELYVDHVVQIFRELKRVLRADGTLWLNLGDSYAASRSYQVAQTKDIGSKRQLASDFNDMPMSVPPGLKQKDLVGIPWMVAFALRADGWYLRSDIIWSKPNPMPESVTDRPTKSHEYLFLLGKSERYYYNAEAIKEPAQLWTGQAATFERSGQVSEHILPGQSAAQHRAVRTVKQEGKNSRINISRDPSHEREYNGKNRREDDQWSGRRMLKNVRQAREETGSHDAPFGAMRNKRSVWSIATAPFPDAHFATFPPELITPCILAGSEAGATVIDPFAGSGTTAKVAIGLGRKTIAIEPKAEYVEMIKKRCQTTIGLPLAI